MSYSTSDICPCGTGLPYMNCCGLYILGKAAPTALALMRSRYTAFTLGDVTYLAKTHPSKSTPEELAALKEWALSVTWVGLDIIESSEQGELGYVEFKAHFRFDGKQDVIHERSRFQNIQGLWYYIDGKAPQQTPIRVHTQERNQACACGSRLKYKKCCGRAM